MERKKMYFTKLLENNGNCSKIMEMVRNRLKSLSNNRNRKEIIETARKKFKWVENYGNGGK